MRPSYASICKFYVREALVMSGIVLALPHMAATPRRSNFDHAESSDCISFLLRFFSLSYSHLTRPLDFVHVANYPKPRRLFALVLALSKLSVLSHGQLIIHLPWLS